MQEVQTKLLEQKRQLDAAIDRLTFKIGRYEVAMKTGVLSWEDSEEDIN